jgi:NAD-dependent deacetylase
MINLVVLTGAGISAESGIATFRTGSGLWNDHDVMKVATPKGFASDPELVHNFYNSRRSELKTVEPNEGHKALARLEEAWKDIGGFLLVTQNVDDLHERAGSTNIAHMHGELGSICCTVCDHSERTEQDTTVNSACPSCNAPMRPDVVWFGEMPKFLDELERVLDNTNVFISIGTSGSVMPASLFPATVRMAKPEADIVEVNPVPTGDPAFNKSIAKTAVEALPQLVEDLIARYGT